jgi:hypothetical protein
LAINSSNRKERKIDSVVVAPTKKLFVTIADRMPMGNEMTKM